MVYLLIGEDSYSKEIKIDSLKKELLTKELEQFNLDILYASQLNLIELQERLLCLPFKARKRIVIIKEAEELNREIKEFIYKYVRKPYPWICLILDINYLDPKDELIERTSGFVKIHRFKQSYLLNTFTLIRQIELNHPETALKVLNQLLEGEEKPERLLGSLRSAFQSHLLNPIIFKKRLKALLHCDLEIKTGRLNPHFALEKLIINLCYLK
ncbi:MAG: hypothetical protein NC912_03455 [Candidatus Omnitrophica bacterium]|nr:hypothetical protein [Candidatus Omnitrophota bacterium]